jgi:hypothetical protein
MSFWDKVPRFDYARDLHIHLKGWASDCNSGYVGQNVYQSVFLVLLVLAGIFAANFYFGVFNRPKFSRRRVWLLNMLTVSTLVFIWAYIMSSSGMHDGRHCADLHFNGGDCMLFAFTAAIYTALFFTAYSFLIKWFSLNNKRVPF